jgi:hypothetical protein
MRILFVTAYPITTNELWRLSRCDIRHEFMQMMTGLNIEDSIDEIMKIDPDVILLSYDTGSTSFTGADLARALQKKGIRAVIVENTSTKFDDFCRHKVRLDCNVQEDPRKLALLIGSIKKKTFRRVV